MKKNIKIIKSNLYKNSRFIVVSFFLLFPLFFNTIYAQINRLTPLKKALSSEPRPLVKADFKHSFISNQLITMRGIKVGLNFDDSIKLGVGYSWMKNNFVFDNPNTIINNETYELKYSYISLFFDYPFYNYLRWNYIFSSDFALGKFAYKNKKTRKKDYTSFGLVIEPSVAVEYRVLKYLIVGGGLGFRFVFRDKVNVTERFSAPLYIIRLKIDFTSLYHNYIKE